MSYYANHVVLYLYETQNRVLRILRYAILGRKIRTAILTVRHSLIDVNFEVFFADFGMWPDVAEIATFFFQKVGET